MTILTPDTTGRRSIKREHPFLMEFVLHMNSCFIQYNAPPVKDVNPVQLINLFCQEQLVFCQTQINLIIFEVQIVPVTIHDNIEIVCISLQVYTYFSSAILYWPF